MQKLRVDFIRSYPYSGYFSVVDLDPVFLVGRIRTPHGPATFLFYGWDGFRTNAYNFGHTRIPNEFARETCLQKTL